MVFKFKIPNIMMSRNGHNDGDGKFNWINALLDASIAAGLTFFTTLAGVSIVRIFDEPAPCIVAAGISAGAQFFIWLAMKRGIVKRDD